MHRGRDVTAGETTHIISPAATAAVEMKSENSFYRAAAAAVVAVNFRPRGAERNLLSCRWTCSTRAEDEAARIPTIVSLRDEEESELTIALSQDRPHS